MTEEAKPFVTQISQHEQRRVTQLHFAFLCKPSGMIRHRAQCCNQEHPYSGQCALLRCSTRQHLFGEVKLNMSGAALHGGQYLWGRRACDGMNLLNLIHLIGPWKEWEQAHHLQRAHWWSLVRDASYGLSGMTNHATR